LALTAVLLGGCYADREITGSTGPDSYEDRHPIVVTEGDATLDLPVGQGPGGLTNRQRRELAAFAASWGKSGRGVVMMQLPHGGPSDKASAYVAPEIRTVLTAYGVPASGIVVRRYAAPPGDAAAPVRLTFPRLVAKVPHPCGLWPDDMGTGGGFAEVAANREYYNFGCATQQNLAAMVADPEDLLRPRPSDPIYAPRRQTVVEKYRKGENMTTAYPNEVEAKASDVGQ
jgi:pilus assembly protein CpaD